MNARPRTTGSRLTIRVPVPSASVARSRRRRIDDGRVHFPAGLIEFFPRAGDGAPFTRLPFESRGNIGQPDGPDGPRRTLERMRGPNTVRIISRRVERFERPRDLIDEEPQNLAFQRPVPKRIASEMIAIDDRSYSQGESG